MYMEKEILRKPLLSTNDTSGQYLVSEVTMDNFPIIWQSVRIHATDSYDTPPEMLVINGSTIGTLGNFSASTGKAKSKKTFNVSAIVAAALSGKEVLRYKAILPEGKDHILYIDTEQSSFHCHKVLERILRLAGLPEDRDESRLEFIMLREYTPNARKRIIDIALAMRPNLGLVIIDGVRDLMYDINSPSESVELINLLMRWSAHYNLHIHTVLHLNKGDDNTRGHIGTELNNKAETVLQITKNVTDASVSEVRAMHMRDREFEPFAFRVDDDALPHLIDIQLCSKPSKRQQITELTEEQHRSALENGFSEAEPMGYNQASELLASCYASIGFKRGRNIMVQLLKHLQKEGLIVKYGDKYQYKASSGSLV